MLESKDFDTVREDDADEGIRKSTGQSFLNIGEPVELTRVSRGGYDDHDINALVRALSFAVTGCGDVWRDKDRIMQQGTLNETTTAFRCASAWHACHQYLSRKSEKEASS